MNIYFVTVQVDYAPACFVVRAESHAGAKKTVRESLKESTRSSMTRENLTSRKLDTSGPAEIVEAWIQ